MFSFCAKLPAASRQDLEDLLFFNSHQSRYRARIVEVIQRFGTPQVVEEGGQLALRLPGHPTGTQCLFALWEGELVGALVYSRERPEQIVLLHIAVDDDYVQGGRETQRGTTLCLMEQLRQIAARIRGVETIRILYGRGVTLDLPVDAPLGPSA